MPTATWFSGFLPNRGTISPLESLSPGPLDAVNRKSNFCAVHSLASGANVHGAVFAKKVSVGEIQLLGHFENIPGRQDDVRPVDAAFAALGAVERKGVVKADGERFDTRAGIMVVPTMLTVPTMRKIRARYGVRKRNAAFWSPKGRLRLLRQNDRPAIPRNHVIYT